MKTIKKTTKRRTSDKERKYLPLADALAVQRGYGDEEIFAILGGEVSLSWIARKRSEHKWNERHADVQTSTNYVAETMRRLLKNTVQQWDKEEGVIDGKTADLFAKVVSNIKRVEAQYDQLASTQFVMNEFVEYLQLHARDAEAYRILIPHVVEFTQFVRNKFLEKR